MNIVDFFERIIENRLSGRKTEQLMNDCNIDEKIKTALINRDSAAIKDFYNQGYMWSDIEGIVSLPIQ